MVAPPYVRDGLRSRTVTHDDELSAIDVPVSLTHGEEDAVVTPQAARNADALDDAETSSYPDTGHTPFLERPDRFTRALREFALGV